MSGSFSIAARAVGLLFAGVATVAAAQEAGSTDMGRANRAAAKVLQERMAEERPADFALLRKTERAEIIVVSGEYDKVEDVLRAINVPHVVIAPRQLAKLELNAKQLLIIDCPGYISPDAVQKVRKFVNAGGFLYTTDWALSNVVQKAFPGFVAFNGRATNNDVVEIEVRRKDNNFLKHLQLSKENPKWWLESSSYPIKVLNPDKVEVLITSREMKRKYGESPIAITFPYGDGRVLHIASHFYLQQNQIRTVAAAKAGNKYLGEDSGLSATVTQKLDSDVDVRATKAGDLESAYAAQQMTSNLVVERQKDKARIDRLYSDTLRINQPAGPTSAPMPQGAKVHVLERREDKVHVRGMDGEEAWVSPSAL